MHGDDVHTFLCSAPEVVLGPCSSPRLLYNRPSSLHTFSLPGSPFSLYLRCALETRRDVSRGFILELYCICSTLEVAFSLIFSWNLSLSTKFFCTFNSAPSAAFRTTVRPQILNPELVALWQLSSRALSALCREAFGLNCRVSCTVTNLWKSNEIGRVFVSRRLQKLSLCDQARSLITVDVQQLPRWGDARVNLRVPSPRAQLRRSG